MEAPDNALHPAAALGFGSSAAAYGRGRPDYPTKIADWLVQALGLKLGVTVLELGAGTGKFTKWLQQTGATIIASEPVDAMRSALQAAFPEIRILDNRAEAIPLPDSSVDVIVCAQAFHWFANGAAVAEMDRVLRPGGELCLIWNVRDESVEWMKAVTALMEPFEGDAPRFHTGQWRTALDRSPFSVQEHVVIEHTHVGAPSSVVVDRFMSVSFIAQLAETQRRVIKDQLEALIATDDGLRDRDIVVAPYKTHVYRYSKAS